MNFFSVAIPTYGYNGRGAEFLDHNFEMLSRQRFNDFEVVVSDHSIDETIYDVCSKWDNLDITYIRCDKGRGIISPNINNAIRHCTGEYVKVLFQDDFLFDEYSLEIQNDFIIRNDTKWLMTRFLHSNDGKTFYRDMTPRWTDDIWTGNNLLGCPSGLTLIHENVAEFDEKLNWLMDCDFYMKLYQKYGEPHIIDEVTTVNRTWGKRLTDTIPQEIRDKESSIMTSRWGKI